MTGTEMITEVGGLINFNPSDTGADASVRLKILRKLNQARDRVVADLRLINLKTGTFATVASTFLYTPFRDLDRIYVMRDTDEDVKLTRMNAWDFYYRVPDPTGNGASGNPSHYIDDLGASTAGFKQLGLYPVPDSVLTMYCIYRALMPEIQNDDYTTGTVTTTASTAVTGATTAWTSAMVGRYFRVNSDNYWYKISAVGSTTGLTLASAYAGTTGASQAYTIAERYAFDGQSSLIDLAICTYAKYLLTITDRIYADLMSVLNMEYKDIIKTIQGSYINDPDEQHMLQGEVINQEPNFVGFGFREIN